MSLRLLISAISFTTFLFGIAANSYAFSFLGFNPVDTAIQIVKAPAQTVINAAKAATGSGSARAILDPLKDVARSLAPLTRPLAPLASLTASIATWPQEQVFELARSAAEKAGRPGELIFDIATFCQSYQDQLINSGASVASDTLLGRNPLEFVAIPLAAAIREGRARHIDKARPLPDDVRKALSHFYSQDVLERAKYTVGTVEISLPNGIGKVRKFFGDDVGVVVDDVIVFPVDPGSFKDNPAWWGHEVLHVQQYGEWGIDEFAFRYVKSLSHEIEDPAYARGDEVLSWSRQNLTDENGSRVTLSVRNQHVQNDPQSDPLLPAAYVQLQAGQGSTSQAGTGALQGPSDPVVIQCIFPGDPNLYYGTQDRRIVVVDPRSGQWMQIGWAMKPDIRGPAWVYFIPGRLFYDVFADGAIMRRPPIGPAGAMAPPIQVGYVARLQ